MKKRNKLITLGSIISAFIIAALFLIACIFIDEGSEVSVAKKKKEFLTDIVVTLDGAIEHKEKPLKWEEYVEMRDGVRLHTTIYLPDPVVHGPGPYPTIITRTPYGPGLYQTGWPDIPVPEFPPDVFYGYAFVHQDIRGRFLSEGIDRIFTDDAQDGYDTVERAALQPWCNGRIGMSGSHSMGITTYLAASERPPHLVAIFSASATANLYNDLLFDGGAIRIGDAMIWTTDRVFHLSPYHLEKVLCPHRPCWNFFKKNIYFLYLKLILYDLYYHTSTESPLRPVDSKWWMYLPYKDYPYSSILQPYWNEVLSHPSEDEWRGVLDVIDKIDVPAIHASGWHGFFARGIVDAFVSLQYKDNQKLFMGPGTQFDIPWPHDKDNYDPYYPKFAWFDYWLKGIDTGIMDEPSVIYYCIGAGEWKSEDQWPPKGISYIKYYLHSDGVLTTDSPEPGEEPRSYIYDPKDPVITCGGRNLILPAGSLDQRPVEEGRSDVLIYTSRVLEKEVEIAGPVEVILSASSSALDTDFTAKLIDVHPDGSTMLVLDNIIRGRYRESMEKPVLLEPGEIYEFTINLGDISYLFKVGHRIQVDISSSNFPKHDRNLNTGKALYIDTDMVEAKNTIYHDANHPSYIVLPLTRYVQ